jgi:hypothetical protein
MLEEKVLTDTAGLQYAKRNQVSIEVSTERVSSASASRDQSRREAEVKDLTFTASARLRR